MIKFKNSGEIKYIDELDNGATFLVNNSSYIVTDEYDGNMRLCVDLNTGTIRRYAKNCEVRTCNITAEVDI